LCGLLFLRPFTNLILESFTVQSLHAALHVKVHGAGHPAAVLLLHGGPGTPDYLDEVAAHLGRRFRAITFDQRGTGRSRALDGSYALDRYLDDINAVADHFGLGSFHLLGHSWGGLLAQLYARQFAPRLRSLFLCSPIPGPGRQWAAMIAEESLFIARRFSVPDLLRIGSGWVRGELGRSEAGWQQFYGTVWKYYFADPGAAPPLDPALRAGISGKAAAGTVRAILQTSARVLDGLGEALPVPVGVLYAQRDFIQRTRRPVQKRFPAARYYEIPGASHVTWADNPAAFYGALDDFYGQIKTA
jgi:proline iminopeptidase